MSLLYKISVLTISLIIFSLAGFSQTSNPYLQKFSNSFIEKINYPKVLADNCIPTYTILHIRIDKKGLVSKMEVSDSADTLLKKEIQTKNLNLIALNQYCKSKGLKNASLLIPVCFIIISNACQTKGIDMDTLQHQMSFNGKQLEGKFMMLPLIKDEVVINVDR